jgi:tetratricopeptide (TPR) repeat protein
MFVVILLVTVLSITSRASAETSEAAGEDGAQQSESPTEDVRLVEAARAHFFRGVKYYEGGDFRWALLEFQRAFGISGNYRILYNLGRVSQELNQYAEATKAFEDYLRLGGDDIEEERRKEVERELESLRPRTARLKIAVNVEGAEVLVDNHVVGRSPLEKGVLVDVGEHFVAVKHPGYVQADKKIVLAAGDDIEEDVTLRKAVAAQKVKLHRPLVIHEREGPSQPPAEDSLSFAAKATWMGTGVLALGAGVTGTLALLEARKLGDLRDSLGSTQEERDSTQHKAEILALTADGLAGAALLTGIAAVYLTLDSGSNSAPEQETGASVALQGTRINFTYRY